MRISLLLVNSIPYNGQVFMAQPTDQNQTKGQGASSSEENSGENAEMISLDQIDSMILSEDPKFAEELKEVKSLPVDGNIDLDVVDLGQTFLNDRENPWRDTFGFRKVVVTILPFLPFIWDLYYRLGDNIYFFRTRLKTSLIQAGPLLLQATKNAAAASGVFLKERLAAFKALKTPMKLLAMVLMLGCVLTAAFIYRSLTHGVLPPNKEILIASLEEWAGASYKYDAETEMDSFYDSPRTIQNIMSLPKMIVNLRPSGGSGPNPMAAMEFYLEGMSPEAIVEVKDREPEVRDLFQRTMEEMSFNELDMPEGKQLLTERLRQALNAVLTTGKVRRVFIKESVLKP
jgi:flagellar basal body-associated protein FliL